MTDYLNPHRIYPDMQNQPDLNLQVPYYDTKPAVDCPVCGGMYKDMPCEVCGCWKDDSQAVQERSEKFYWDMPGIYIKIDRLGDGQNE